MTEQSPADTIRSAVAVLREQAQAARKASPDPWAVTDEHVVRCSDGMIVADRSGTDHPAERADLPYIATMHPGVGLVLADWLDSVAKRHIPQVAVRYFPDLKEYEVCERCDLLEDEQRWPCPDIEHALAVARAIVGEGVPCVP